jgi:hypothetical protein
MDPPDERLVQTRRALGEKLAEQLADPQASLVTLRELDERTRLLDATIAARRPPPPRRLGAVLWPFACVALLLLAAATLRWPGSVPVTLELRASTVTATLPGALTTEARSIEGELRLEGFSAIEAAPGALAALGAEEQVDPVAVRSDQTRLRALALPGAAELTLQVRGGRLSLAVESSRSPVVAHVELRGRSAVRAGDTPGPLEASLERAEWLRLVAGSAVAADRAAPPVELSWPLGPPATAPRFVELMPSALRFAERRAGAGVGATARWRSGVEGGQLTLAATGQVLPIAAGDWLEIDGLATERCEIAVAGDLLTLKLNGSAQALRLRAGSLERSLKPTLLEYLSRHHVATLLWSSAVALWGAIAWTRRQFAQRP